MIPSIMCYVPPYVELLGPTTPNFRSRLSPLRPSYLYRAPIFKSVCLLIRPTIYPIACTPIFCFLQRYSMGYNITILF